MIMIDGSYMEGGGQICRTALALSAITGKDFLIENIRKGREKPGLKAQHLNSVMALKKMCGCKIKGAELGSEMLEFSGCGKVKKGMNIDIGTAGSITLLLQSLMLPCCFAEKKVRLEIIGGTDVSWSMPIDYLKEVVVPQFRRVCDINMKLVKRGFYPKGSGKVEILFKPKENRREIKLVERGKLMQIKGVSFASSELMDAKVAERQANAAKKMLAVYGVNVEIRTEYCETLSAGSGIVLWAKFGNKHNEMDNENPVILGSDALGEKGRRSEDVGEEAASKLKNEIDSKACVDTNLADNIVPLLGILGGEIRVSSLSKHTLTNIWTTELFLGKVFEVDKLGMIVKAKVFK